MPYITVGLEVRIDPRWLEIPPTLRAKVKALYIDALSYSGELLTNGHVSHSVMVGIAHELGVERPQKVLAFLVDSGHASVTETGYFLHEWEQFHNSRETVLQRRIDAAKRKRASRAQTRLPLSRTESQQDTPGTSQSDSDVTHAGASAHAKQHQHQEEIDPNQGFSRNQDPEPDIAAGSSNGALGDPLVKALVSQSLEEPETSTDDIPF